MKKIEDIIKRVKKPTDVIDINWIRDIQYNQFDALTFKELITEIIQEYIITRDISYHIIEFLQSFLERIKAQGEKKVKKKINFFLRGEYGTGKTHFLTFLSLLLLNDEKIQGLFNLNQDFKKNTQIIHYSKELRKSFNNDLLICPIKLTDFTNDTRLIEIIRYSLQDIAINKYDDNEIRLFSIYNTIDWFKNKLSPEIRTLILNDLDRITRNRISDDISNLNNLEFEELIEIQQNLIRTYEDKMSTKFTVDMENKKLSEVIKNSTLTKKNNVKHILIILDELSQWWGSKTEADLINQLHGLVEDFRNDLDLNISLIVSYQKNLRSNEFITLKERLKKVWIIESSEFKDIVPRRCLDHTSLDHNEIEKIALFFSNHIQNTLKPSESLLKKYIFFDDKIVYRNTKEGIYNYFKLFYPFHPTIFIPEIWGEIGKYSTEMRGGMNIIVKLLEKNLNNNYDELINPNEVINEFLKDIFKANQYLSLFYRKIQNDLKLDEDSIELKIIKLLFVFREGMTVEGFNLIFLKDISKEIKDFHKKMITNGIIELTYESATKKYLLSFEAVINIDTYINKLENLIDYENILNYLQYELNLGDFSKDFTDDYGSLIPKFNYVFIKNSFLNIDDFDEIESNINDDLEENKLNLTNHSDHFITINRFIETAIPDGFAYYFKPKLNDINNFFENKFKENKKIIFAYTDKELKDIEYFNFNLSKILQLNLILNILKTILEESGDLMQTSTNLFEDVFNIFQEKYQNEIQLNLFDINLFWEPLREFHNICIKNSTIISAELAERLRKIPEIDEQFFLKFKSLYRYYYYGDEYDNYEIARERFKRENFSAGLDPIDQFFTPPKINHLLNCLKTFDEYKTNVKTQKETLNFYSELGFLKKISAGKFKVSLDFKKIYIKPIEDLILSILNDDPIAIKNILIDLRHSEHNINFEYTLLSIVALFAEGYIKIMKDSGDALEPFPQTLSDKDKFCRTINQLNTLSKSTFYIKKGDLISKKDWSHLIQFLQFLRDSRLFPELNKIRLENYNDMHNVNIERTVFKLVQGLRLSKISLINGNIENFIEGIDFDDEIIANFKFQGKIEGISNVIEELIKCEDIDEVVEKLKNFNVHEYSSISTWLEFFENKEKFRKVITISKMLKKILGN